MPSGAASGSALAGWLTLWQAKVVLAPGLDAGPLFSRFVHDGVLLAAAALCLWAGFASPHRRERRAWLLIGAGVAAWTFGEIYYTAVLWTADEIPIPSPADVGYLLFPPFMLLGVVALLRSRARDVPGTLWADGITAALAVSAASAALVFQTVQEAASGQAMEVAVGLAYPIADLILLGVIVGALAGTGWQLDRTWVLLFLGVAVFWLADSLYLVGNANGTYTPGVVVRQRLVARDGPDRRRRLAAGAARAARPAPTSGCAGSSCRCASAPPASPCSSTAAWPTSTSSPSGSPPPRCSRSWRARC